MTHPFQQEGEDLAPQAPPPDAGEQVNTNRKARQESAAPGMGRGGTRAEVDGAPGTSGAGASRGSFSSLSLELLSLSESEELLPLLLLICSMMSTSALSSGIDDRAGSARQAFRTQARAKPRATRDT